VAIRVANEHNKRIGIVMVPFRRALSVANELHEVGNMLAASLKTWRVVIAVGCVSVVAAAGCSSGSAVSAHGTSASASATTPATAVVNAPPISGIGATRTDWEASHTRNEAVGPNSEKDGGAYGVDPSLAPYLAPGGAVYVSVSDLGTERIQIYVLNLHTSDRDRALARVRQELPSDATPAWDLTLNECFRATFNSATLRSAGPYMAEVQLDDVKEDGTSSPNPRRFNRALFTLYTAGTPPNPDTEC
jgi:hypothetical protein